MRLKSEIWVQSYLRLLASDNIAAAIVHKGEESAGTIYILSNMLNGHVHIFTPAPIFYEQNEHERYWQAYKNGESISEKDATEYLDKQRRFDPDLWLIELEDPQGRSFLGSHLISNSPQNPLDKLFR